MNLTGWPRMGWTLVLVFTGAFLAQVAASGLDLWADNSELLRQATNAGLAAVIAVVLNWLSPLNGQYGIGSRD